MDTGVLSTGVRSSNSPESYARPESDRPRLSEVSARDTDNVRDWGNDLGLSTGSNPPDFNSREGEHFYNEGSSEASDEGGPFKVPAPDCKSNLESRDLRWIRIIYQIPNDVFLRVPNYVDNVCSVNEGEIVLYEASLKAGLRLPFHPFIGELLRRIGLAPGQLVPNAWKIVVGWLKLWQKYGEESAELSVDKFLYCYQLHKSPRSSSHWFFFARDNDSKLGIKLPSSNGPWKSNYFVVRGEALLEGVKCSWGYPNIFVRPNLDDFHLNRVKKVVEFSRRDHNSEDECKDPITEEGQVTDSGQGEGGRHPPTVDTDEPVPCGGRGREDPRYGFRDGNEDLERATANRDVMMMNVEHLEREPKRMKLVKHHSI